MKNTHHLPPHLIDEVSETEENETKYTKSKIGKQGPSKYGVGGRRVAKSKGRKS